MSEWLMRKVKTNLNGSGCGSVGRAVASNSRGLWFKSSHRQKILLNIYCQLFWKDKNKIKEDGNGPFFGEGLKVLFHLLCSWFFDEFFLATSPRSWWVAVSGGWGNPPRWGFVSPPPSGRGHRLHPSVRMQNFLSFTYSNNPDWSDWTKFVHYG